MKILFKIIQFILYRSKISHQTFAPRLDSFFEILEYQSIEKKNLEDRFEQLFLK